MADSQILDLDVLVPRAWKRIKHKGRLHVVLHPADIEGDAFYELVALQEELSGSNDPNIVARISRVIHAMVPTLEEAELRKLSATKITAILLHIQTAPEGDKDPLAPKPSE